jgi:hypothetical protein
MGTVFSLPSGICRAGLNLPRRDESDMNLTNAILEKFSSPGIILQIDSDCPSLYFVFNEWWLGLPQFQIF